MKNIHFRPSLPLTIGAALLLTLFATSNSYAIPASYGTATHNTTSWQELATYDHTTNTLTDENGVFWSTDGGTTWGHDELSVGDTIQFQFNMHKRNVGTHYADHLKVWLDWDQDGTFNELNDVIAYEEEELLDNESGNLGSWNDPNVPNFTYYTGSFTILDEFIGDLYLRARVTCSESLVKEAGGNWNDQWDPNKPYLGNYSDFFAATGYYGQGEVEEWRLTVNPNEVPEPATMLLFGTGLAGLAGLRRKQLKKK